MRSMFRQPMFWLGSVALLSLALCLNRHGFQPERQPDSASYQNFDWSSLRAVLSSTRTIGYPIFLKFVGWIPGEHVVPIAQWTLWSLAVGVFYRGLRLAGFRPGTAVWGAGPLLLSHGVLQYAAVVIPDCLAMSWAIAATGCFLATFGARPSKWSWCALTVATFCCYLTRPAYLFLIPLWPLLAFLFHRTLYRGHSERRSVVQYIAATLLPFLAFSSTRWLVVGHFGLVSFGGFNLVGVMGQFLDPATAAELPEDLRPLASDVLSRRAMIPEYQPPQSYEAMAEMFNPTVWQAAAPAAMDLYSDDVAVNAALSRLSLQLLVLRPAAYGRWLTGGAKLAYQEIAVLIAIDRGTLLLGFLTLLAFIVSLCRGGSKDNPPTMVRDTGEPADESCTRHVEVHLICWTALGFAAAKTLLVILVEPPIGRYMIGAILLLPGAMGVLVGEYVTRVASGVRRMKNGIGASDSGRR